MSKCQEEEGKEELSKTVVEMVVEGEMVIEVYEVEVELVLETLNTNS
jgi:hypothetical protein